MAQITTGFRKLLSISFVYDALQNGLGARKAREELCNKYIRAQPGESMVDVGCGTALILDALPEGIAYHGFDLSEHYIDAAKARYGHRGSFTCADITAMPADAVPSCNIAIAIGILHHLDDEGARTLLENLYHRLAPGGRLITFDPAYWPDQSAIARAIISRDRGQNVRNGDGYVALVPSAFSSVQLNRRDDILRIPYTHAILVCVK